MVISVFLLAGLSTTVLIIFLILSRIQSYETERFRIKCEAERLVSNLELVSNVLGIAQEKTTEPQQK